MCYIYLMVLKVPSHSSEELTEWFGTLPTNNEYFHHSMWPNHMGVEWLIRRSFMKLGVTPYQLARLLGAQGQRTISYWLSGAFRPSPVYMLRLFKLWDWLDEGIPVSLLSKIDWDTCELVWRKGFENGVINHAKD